MMGLLATSYCTELLASLGIFFSFSLTLNHFKMHKKGFVDFPVDSEGVRRLSIK